jgi:hypothetical protein
MGIARAAVKLLIQEAQRRPFQGKVVTLGKQDIWIDQDELEKIAKQMQFQLFPCPGIEPLAQKSSMRQQGLISDVYLLSRLGFSEVRSIDFSDYEGADDIFDLNRPELPPHLANACDFILDGGTLEHVFHLPNALKNLFYMLKIDGRIFHISPSSNHIDHGFYMFSPTIFWDYYHANRFDLNRLQILRHNPSQSYPIHIYPYQSGCLGPVSYGGLDSAMYAIHCVVTKTAESTSSAIPQQFAYQEKAWKGKNVAESDHSLLSRLKNQIKQHRFLYQTLRPFGRLLHLRKGIKLKAIAKL